MKTIEIIEGEKKVNFIAKRLLPKDQTFLMLKIIGMIAKGSITNSRLVEQALHNAIYTGVKISGAGKEKVEENSMGKIILEAVKGALANLSDEDRDYVFSELLKTVKIGENSQFDSVSWKDLNFHFQTFVGPMKLFRELIDLNFGFFLNEIKSTSQG